jgi:hypothetical protein
LTLSVACASGPFIMHFAQDLLREVHQLFHFLLQDFIITMQILNLLLLSVVQLSLPLLLGWSSVTLLFFNLLHLVIYVL